MTLRKSTALHSESIKVDPDELLTPDMKSKFTNLHAEYDRVFDPSYRGYNGAAGPFESVVNMGPVQPQQRKGRVLQYLRDKLTELQQKFDELETHGVFKRPEDIGVVVEYLNPSFLVKKSKGGCVCKTMERMINARHVWFLEFSSLITESQSGFRKT